MIPTTDTLRELFIAALQAEADHDDAQQASAPTAAQTPSLSMPISDRMTP